MPELVHNEARLLANAAILADALDLELARVLAFTYAYACLNASWWLRIEADEAQTIIEWFLKVAGIVEPHIAPV
jgi:streptomycin 6-kinase